VGSELLELGLISARRRLLLREILDNGAAVFSGVNIARVGRFLEVHKRAIASLLVFLVFAYSAFLVIHPDELGRFFDLFSVAFTLILIASQLFWIRHIRELGKRVIRSKRCRRGLGAAGLIVYFFLLGNDLFTGEDTFKGSGLTLRAALLEAPFKLWLLGSLLGFLIAVLLRIAAQAARAGSWAFEKLRLTPKRELLSPGRRRFLEKSAIALSAAPFFAGVYGLFYGRLNLETTHQRIKLRRLPKAFEGFRILQLSDIHISAFMSAEEIRRYVAIANQLKADLVVLTGDFVTWEAVTEGAVVQALSALKAPLGVFGCLGNHENLTGTRDSITGLFATEGIHILRQAHIAIQTGNEAFNLMGVDFQSLFGEAPDD
jgi:calcineurin-like phosphoesterase family protein